MRIFIIATVSLPFLFAVAANFWPRQFGVVEDSGPFTPEWAGTPHTALGWPFTYVRLMHKPLPSGVEVAWDGPALAIDCLTVIVLGAFTMGFLLLINALMGQGKGR